jgi:uncharacterized protein YcfL
MKGKTIRTLLISVTMTATILTGCTSNDKTVTTENETVTEEESTTEFETATTEVETTTIEETTTESETTTTEEETSTDEEAVTDTVVKNGITFATDVTSDNMQLIIDACDANVIEKSDFDINGDGVIDEQEIEDGFEDFSAEDIQHAIDRKNQNKAAIESYQSESTTTSSTSTTQPDISIEVRPNNPNGEQIDWDTPIDHTGWSTTGDVY